MSWKICKYGNRMLDQCFSNCVSQHTDVPWKIYRCAASSFKVLYVDTSFVSKLRKCCHEVTTDLCRKSQVPLQVSLIEVMTFFLKDSTILGSIQRFPEIVTQRYDDLQKKSQRCSRYRLRCHLKSIEIDSSGWCAAKFVQLISCAGRRKSLGATTLDLLVQYIVALYDNGHRSKTLRLL